MVQYNKMTFFFNGINIFTSHFYRKALRDYDTNIKQQRGDLVYNKSQNRIAEIENTIHYHKLQEAGIPKTLGVWL